MLQNPCKTLGFKKNMVYKIPPGGGGGKPYPASGLLTEDTNGKVTNSQLDTTNESQEVSPFPAGDHKAHTNRRVQRHSKHKTEKTHKRSTKEVPHWNGQWLSVGSNLYRAGGFMICVCIL